MSAAELKQNVVTGTSFLSGVQNNQSYQDQAGHGTFVAGTVGATTNNDAGIAGISQAVSLYICQFIGASGNGVMSAAVLCINWCLGYNVHVISASWGTTQYLQSLASAVGTVSTSGKVFVASSGNSGLNTDTMPQYPSAFSQSDDGVIAVAATDQSGALWSGSNYGNSSVTVAAPGVQIQGLALGNGYQKLTGECFRAQMSPSLS